MEGLDAAIEAATLAYNAIYIGKPGWNHSFAIRLAVRAASPLIERAALQAAEDALGEEVDNAIEPSDREAFMYACDVVRRLRATRTETP
jgi:uncharacterized protein YpiB (UPF0302 family)